jgi:hypothetical protein
MLRHILEAFFFIQVVAESVVEETTKQFDAAGKQWQEFCANGTSHENNGHDRIGEVTQAAARDAQKVADSVKDLFANILLLLQEYAKHTIPQVCEKVTTVKEKAAEKAAAFHGG